MILSSPPQLSNYSRAAVDLALDSVAPNSHGATVLYPTTTDMRYGVMAKTATGWVFMGNLDREWLGAWSENADVTDVW